eukprot:5389746-Pleurochrysis_carterae.AAC.3
MLDLSFEHCAFILVTTAAITTPARGTTCRSKHRRARVRIVTAHDWLHHTRQRGTKHVKINNTRRSFVTVTSLATLNLGDGALVDADVGEAQ